MKAYERRECAAYPYFKLATWDERNATWRAGRTIYETEGDAYGSIKAKKGMYRLERFEDGGKSETSKPFRI